MLPMSLQAQIGGRHVYDFLNLSPSARVAALGGVNVSTYDDDSNLGYQNPGLVNDSMHEELSLSVVNYLADINYGYASYAHHADKIATTFHGGIQYVNYGSFQGADEYGNLLEEFGANEVAMVVGAARKYKRFGYGANLKLINSNISGFNSFAMALDIGGSYHSIDKLFSAGLVFKNMGVQLSTYTPTGQREPLPFEIQTGLSYKLKYMPLRFSVTATNLEHPQLVYVDPNPEPQYDLSGNLIVPKKQIVDKVFRHFVFGGEFLLGKSLRLRGGYNHLRRQELRSEGRAGMSGFSLGAGIRVYKFRFDYGYSNFHAIGGMHQFSLSSNIGRFRKSN